MADASIFSTSFGNTAQGVSINDTRRKFNFGERVAELAPQQSPFFVYLSKVAKKATNDPVFKFLEQRHQWQRRNFVVTEAFDPAAEAVSEVMAAGVDLHIGQYVDKYGKITSGTNPIYAVVPGCVLAIANDDGTVRRFKVLETATVTNEANTAAGNGAYINHDTTNGHTEITGESLIPLVDAVLVA